MKLEAAFTIDGVVVKKVFSQNGVDVYHADNNVSDLEAYFVNEQGVVLLRQSIGCAMSQGTGFVDTVDYT